MNFAQLRKSVGQRVQLRPCAISIDEYGQIQLNDDAWLIDSVDDDELRISLARTSHFTHLGKDHIHQYTTNPDETRRAGLKHAFLTLTIQLYLRGATVSITPTSRPGEPVFPKSLVPQMLPQPAGALHSPIPAILETPYRRARESLIAAGWQPFRQHWSAQSRPEFQAGNGATFWTLGFHEIDMASPTGLAHCTFKWRDVYGNTLVVVTAGEEHAEAGYEAAVWNWYFDKNANA